MSSPHTRGSSSPRVQDASGRRVVPAHAGVILTEPVPRVDDARRPRTRGGHPVADLVLARDGQSSPHTRGSSSVGVEVLDLQVVVPAHAGVIPTPRAAVALQASRPRTRGGHPTARRALAGAGTSSPHTRGSSRGPHPGHTQRAVFPAHAGVIPGTAASRRLCSRRPRTRGGHPGSRFGPVRSLRSSPHTRGSSLCVVRHRRLVGVVPAHAGVIPRRSPTRRLASCRPRTRGGHPAGTSRLGRRLQSSPHTRGSSRLQSLRLPLQRVVPAHAGGHPGSRGAPCRSW